MKREDIGKWAKRNGKWVKISEKVTRRAYCYTPPDSVVGKTRPWFDTATGRTFYGSDKEQKRKVLDEMGLVEQGRV